MKLGEDSLELNKQYYKCANPEKRRMEKFFDGSFSSPCTRIQYNTQVMQLSNYFAVLRFLNTSFMFKRISLLNNQTQVFQSMNLKKNFERSIGNNTGPVIYYTSDLTLPNLLQAYGGK